MKYTITRSIAGSTLDTLHIRGARAAWREYFTLAVEFRFEGTEIILADPGGAQLARFDTSPGDISQAERERIPAVAGVWSDDFPGYVAPNPEQIRAAIDILGVTTNAQLGRLIGVTDRQVRYWTSGHKPIDFVSWCWIRSRMVNSILLW